jgi:hypothetical protein
MTTAERIIKRKTLPYLRVGAWFIWVHIYIFVAWIGKGKWSVVARNVKLGEPRLEHRDRMKLNKQGILTGDWRQATRKGNELIGLYLFKVGAPLWPLFLIWGRSRASHRTSLMKNWGAEECHKEIKQGLWVIGKGLDVAREWSCDWMTRRSEESALSGVRSQTSLQIEELLYGLSGSYH